MYTLKIGASNHLVISFFQFTLLIPIRFVKLKYFSVTFNVIARQHNINAFQNATLNPALDDFL